MSIPELCIRRPVATALVMLGILLFGVVAYRQLPVDNLPTMDFPTINVNAGLPGANPDTMAGAVATPLERRFSTIPGLESMNSNNTLGRTSITLQFSLDRDIDGAAQDVQAQISQAARGLPADMPAPPSYSKANPADAPVLIIQLTSPSLPLSTVDRYAETFIAPRISTINGVSQVQVSGAQKWAVRIQLDPRALATRQIGMDDIQQALNSGNVNMPTGTLWGSHQALTLQATGQLYDAAAYKQLIVTYRGGSPVRLGELGNVIDSVENDKTANWFDGVRNIGLQVLRQPGANTPEVVDKVMAVLPELIRELPPAIEIHVAIDRSLPVRQSVEDVKFTLMLSLFLVIMVIFLFLRSFAATAIPSIALPISIFGTFAVMYLCGYKLDNLSLMALTLSVGFVVDDAIVMLENIVRHMELGKGVLEASQFGSREIGFTIISMTLSLTAVFIPILFMGGVLGRLLHEFAVTIMSAVLVSGVVSLTLTPMLCSRFLRPHSEEKHGRFFNAFESVQTGMTNVYGWFLRIALRQKLATMTAAIVLLACTAYLYTVVPKGFLQSEDTGQFQLRTEAIEGASFDEMVVKQQQIAQILHEDPYVLNVSSGLGMGTINQGNGFVNLVPRSQRPHVDQVIQELRPKLARVPGMNVYLSNPPPFRIGGIGGNALYQYTLQDTNTEELYGISGDFAAKMRALPGLLDVSSDAQIKNPQVSIVMDRDKASSLGVTAQQVEDALYSAFGQRQVSTIFAPDDQYHVMLELLPDDQRDPTALSTLYVHAKGGQLIPLNAVATFVKNYGPLSVNHLGQLPAVTISFNLGPNVALGDAVEEITELARQNLPASINGSFQGNAQAFQSSMSGLGLLLLMAVAVIYIVLGILYESFIHPITILSGLPSAGFGALLALEVFHLAAQKHLVSPQLDLSLDLYGFVGIIMLVGIVKKNAIMMIDFAVEAQRNQGLTAAEAIYQGCLVRFRPIMMTTMAALMGTLPIAMGIGAGAETRRPLGVAVVGGLIFSQLVTLFLTPVVFVYMEQATQWASRRSGSRTEVPGGSHMPGPVSPTGMGDPIARSASPKLPESNRSDLY